MFTDKFNNSGCVDGSTSSFVTSSSIIPFGFILTQYTITGFDASAHLSEETQGASKAAAQGHLAVDLLLGRRRLHPAAGRDVRHPGQVDGAPDYASIPAGGVAYIFDAGAGRELGRAAAVHLVLRAVVLRDRLPDLAPRG